MLRSVIPLPGVYAPQNKDVSSGQAAANLGGSGGFEGMAINKSGTRLYTLLEKTVSGDPVKMLRINEFDIASEGYTGVGYFYPLDPNGTNIGDMTAVDDHRFIVIERNGGTATNGTVPFKKLYLIDIEGVAQRQRGREDRAGRPDEPRRPRRPERATAAPSSRCRT